MSETTGTSEEQLGVLWSTTGQWAEARGFIRVYGHNPFAQEELVRVLCGLWKQASEGWRPNQECSGGIESAVAARGIENTIRYMREQLPEWASLEPVSVDNEVSYEDYPGCDPHLKHHVEIQILGGVFDNGGVE